LPHQLQRLGQLGQEFVAELGVDVEEGHQGLAVGVVLPGVVRAALALMAR
jgi:hypothetical protein